MAVIRVEPHFGVPWGAPPGSVLPSPYLAFGATHWSDKCTFRHFSGGDSTVKHFEPKHQASTMLRARMHCVEQQSHGLPPRPVVTGTFHCSPDWCSVVSVPPSLLLGTPREHEIRCQPLVSGPGLPQRGRVSESLRGPRVCLYFRGSPSNSAAQSDLRSTALTSYFPSVVVRKELRCELGAW